MNNRANLGLTPHQAIETLWTVLFNFGVLIMWLTFTVFHLGLLAIGLALLWYFQVTPSQLVAWAQQISQSTFAASASTVFAFAGLSALALLLFYVRLWRKIYAAITAKVVMKDL